jgi:hypothetical protein
MFRSHDLSEQLAKLPRVAKQRFRRERHIDMEA